jgi:hypothetical protein
MAEFPGSFPGEGCFFVNGVIPLQKRVRNKIRLTEEIKVFRSVYKKRNGITVRFFVEDAVILEPFPVEQGKPVASLITPVLDIPGVSP